MSTLNKIKRKLSTILAADCAGFSSLMDQNEELTLKNLKFCRSIIDPIINNYKGHIFYTAGDSVIADFSSPVNAVNTGYIVDAVYIVDAIYTTETENVYCRYSTYFIYSIYCRYSVHCR